MRLIGPQPMICSCYLLGIIMAAEEWCASELSKLLKTPSEEIARYLVSVTNEHDLDTVLSDILVGAPDFERTEFVNTLKSKINCARGYRKAAQVDDDLQKKNLGNKKKNKTNVQDNQGQDTNLNNAPKKDQPEANTSRHRKKKAHFVSIYGRESDVVVLPGRNACTCLASRHILINNCLSCGRIVCKQEGSGPCFTCHQWVGTPEEVLMRKKMGIKKEIEDESLIKAREQRDKLIKNSTDYERGASVIDDQTDFYSAENTKWMSAEEKEASRKTEELREQQKAARKTKRFNLDFAGRKVIECRDDLESSHPSSFQAIVPKSYYQTETIREISNVAPNIDFDPPTYVCNLHVESRTDNGAKETLGNNVGRIRNLRLQDADLQLMSDDGMCLSMHQPWASLLIGGIKVHEGRSWYTSHRGCLWIHAAKKEPTQSEIAEIENNIKCLGDKSVVFPKHYQTSCLLGCATVVDCLSQEEYRLQYPCGESGSPYVFICENPQELMLKLPMNGKHKIFKMDGSIHSAAKKMLRKSPALN